MALNKIVELGLESKANELKEKNKGEVEIARILSACANKTVTRSGVHRYFAAKDRANRGVIEKSNKLKEKVIELELDTVQARHELIKGLRELAKRAEEEGDIRTAMYGFEKAIAAIDSLDKRLGKLSPESITAVVIKVIHEQQS
jgi:hypothetical protein